MSRTDRRLVLIAAIVYFVQIPLIAGAFALLASGLVEAHRAADAPALTWVVFASLWLNAVLGVLLAFNQGLANLEDYLAARRDAVRSGGVR